MSRSEDFLLLLTCGLAFGCDPAVGPNEDEGSGGGHGDQHDAVLAAVETCEPFVNKTLECSEEEEDVAEGGDYWYGSVGYVSIMGYCIAQIGYAQQLGEDCGTAYDEYFACLASVDCSELFGEVVSESDGDEAGGDDGEDEEEERPCAMQEAAIEASCNGPSVEGHDDED